MMRPFSATSKTALRLLSHRHQSFDLRYGCILLRDEFDRKRSSLMLRRFSSIARIGERGIVEEGSRAKEDITKWDASSAGIGTRQDTGFLGCGAGNEDGRLAKTYKEEFLLGYSPEQLFAVVAAVDLYADFIPWCQRSMILRHKNDESFDVELQITFKFLVERYLSHVELKKPKFIKTTVLESNLFEHLIYIWEFNNGPIPGSCDLHLFVDFRLQSSMYQQVANMFFKEAVSYLVCSFKQRCHAIYGPGVQVLEGAYGIQRSEVSDHVAVLLKQSLQVQILDALHSGEKKMAMNFLQYLGSLQDSLKIEDCMPLLEHCSKAPDPQFVMELWRFMEGKKLNIDKNCYSHILRALSKGGYLDEALNLLKLLGENSQLKPGLSMYNIFLSGCSENNSLTHANYCLELMENKSIGKSQRTYSELMKLAVQGQNLSDVNQVWREHTKFYRPNILSFRKLIWSFCRLRAPLEANEALQEMVTVVSKEKYALQRSRDGRYCASKLDIPIPIKICQEDVTESLIQKYSTGGLPVSFGSGTFREDMLSAPLSHTNGLVMKNRDWDIMDRSTKDAFDFGSQLLFDSINENNAKSQSLHAHCIHEADVYPGKQDVLVANKASATMHPETVDSGPRVKELILKGRDDAVLNLKEISCLPALNVLIRSFNDVIHAAALTRNYQLVEHLFLQMHNLGLEPSLYTYNGFLKAVVLERGVIHGMRVIKAMENKNLKPDNFTYATLSIGYSKSLELDLAEAMLDQMADKQPQYRHPFNSLLIACRIADEPERAVRVLARMKLVEVKPNIRTYELLFSLFGNVNPPYEQGTQQSQEDVLKRISAIEMDMVRNGIEHSQTSMTNLLKALGAEGMVKELLQYLHVAEDQFNGRDAPPLQTNMYNIVLHGLVEAKEWDVATQIFERMKSFGIKPDAATYNIMIDCCSLTGDLQSAHRLMATMLQDGFKVHACTYTILMKIMLANGEFETALNLFSEMEDEGIRSDVVCFNTVLSSASLQGRLDIIEFVVEHMHREKIQPDPDTCLHVFNAYLARGFLDTALEALQVLSIRMVSEDETVQREMKSTFQELLVDEDSNVEEKILEIFKDSREYLAAALFNMRLCSFCGVSNSWVPDQSPWAIRLHSNYNQNQLARQ